MNTVEYLLDGSLLEAGFKVISTPESYLGAGAYLAGKKMFELLYKLAAIFATLVLIKGWIMKNPKIFCLILLSVAALAVLPGCSSVDVKPGEEYKSQNTIYGPEYCSAEKLKFLEVNRELVTCAGTDYKSPKCQDLVAQWSDIKWKYRTCRSRHVDTHVLTHPANIYRR